MLVLATSMPAGAEPRPLGDSTVIARLPAAPGHPEGIAIDGSTVYVATAARFGTSIVPPKGPPEIQAFDTTTGALLRRYAIADLDATKDHGTSGLAFDAAGRLYVLDTQWGVVRFDPSTAPAWIDPAAVPSVIYASMFPDLPPCSPLATVCAPTIADTPPLPNDIAFAPNGDAYVSDSLQATIWRIPAGAGAPQIWFQDARLGGGFGVNGLRFDASNQNIVVTVTADASAAGVVYRIPLGEPSAMTVVHRYVAAEAPDNLAYGSSGKLYVALAGSNQIQVLRDDGTEEARYGGPARSVDGDVTYDMPSGIALDPATRSVLANNHSEILGLPSRFVVFDVYVDDAPLPLNEPTLA